MNFKSSISSDLGDIEWNSTNFINSMILDYEFNKFPRAKINLTLEDMNWLRFRYLDVEIELESYKTEFRLGIDNITNLGNSQILFQGYLADPDLFTKVYSRYLGNDIKSAIRTLGLTQELDVGSVSNDFFQLAETSLNSLDKILLGGMYQGIYTISEKSIKCIPISSIDSNNSPIILPKMPSSVDTDMQFGLESPSKGTYSVTTNSESKKYDLSLYSQYGYNVIAPKNNQYDLNVVSNYIYRNGLSTVFSDTYDTIYDIEIGDIVCIPTKNLDKNKFVVTKLTKVILPNSISSSIEIQR